jgi:hypothetical protein
VDNTTSNLLSILSVAKETKSKTDTKPEKKTRKKKDANAPKKPMSAFFWYQQSRRAPLKLEQPELGHKEVIVVSNINNSLITEYSSPKHFKHRGSP